MALLVRLTGRRRIAWLALGWGWVVLVVWLSLTPRPPMMGIGLPSIDKLYHLLAYLWLMGWLALAVRRQGLTALTLIAMGSLLEVLQGLGGQRHFEWWDMVANGIGVTLAWAIVPWRWWPVAKAP